MPVSVSNETKEAIDKVLKAATEEKKGLPGVIYAVINKGGEFIYEGAAGTKSLAEPDSKVRPLNLYLHIH